MNAPDSSRFASAPRFAWLPAVGSWRYHALLLGMGLFVLGPLCGVTSSYMNFSLGFFVGGQVLAGILGSAVTFGYGSEGKHGANFMQTTAASVADMSALAIVVQAMTWLGVPTPPLPALIAFLLCAGMLGAGVGMLYTPVLVDRLQLTFPSGLAVANILRALTDPALLRRSIGQLGGGALLGVVGGLASTTVPWLESIALSTSTLGAGMIVGARLGIPAVLAGLLFSALKPLFVTIGWLGAGDPFRKISFLIALGLILGAACVDMALIMFSAWQRYRMTDAPAAVEVPDWKRTHRGRLLAWIAFWVVAVLVVGTQFLAQPVGYLAFGVALVFVFALVNGISVGVSDSNPISAAFVVTVLLMASFGLGQPIIGLMAASVVLVATSVACDMQQDRSTGWRLGTNRVIQFRYQVAGVFMGAILAVLFAKLYMTAYPVLNQDQTLASAAEQSVKWSSTMTYKVVGALRSLTEDKPYQRTAIWIGLAIGLAIQVVKKALKSRPGYQRFVASGPTGFVTGFTVDAFLLPSPYALSFGGFVLLQTSLWFGAGGVLSSLINTVAKARDVPAADPAAASALPDDMSATSLWGGGLIAGDSLAALGLGVYGLLSTVVGS